MKKLILILILFVCVSTQAQDLRPAPPTASSLGIDTSKILDPADFQEGEFIMKHLDGFIPASKSDLLGYKELVLNVIISSVDSSMQITVISNTIGIANNSITGTFSADLGFYINFATITGDYHIIFTTQFYYSTTLYAIGGFLADESYNGSTVHNPASFFVSTYNTLWAVNTDNIFDSNIPVIIKFYP